MELTVEQIRELLERFPNNAKIEVPLADFLIVTPNAYNGVCHWPVDMPTADMPDWSRPDSKTAKIRGKLPKGVVRIEVNYGYDGAFDSYEKLKQRPGWHVEAEDGSLEITAPGVELYQWVMKETDRMPADFPELLPYAVKDPQYRCRHCGLTNNVPDSHCGAQMQLVE